MQSYTPNTPSGSKAQNRSVMLGQDPQSLELLTLKQVAALLQVCIKTVRRLILKYDIPKLRVGNQIRIEASHIALFTKKEW